jgi:hypothetical protein
MEPLGDSLRSMNAFDEKVVARVRRHCVTHAKLYLTFGTAIAVSACVTMGALALHADGEARAQTAQQERDQLEIEAIGRRFDDLSAAMRDGFAEVRADIKAIIRGR